MRAADGAILIIALAIAWSLYRANRDIEGFNLLDLVIEHNKVSKLACVFLGSFCVTSWVFVRVAIDGKMTEGLFLAYGGIWVAPIIAKLFSPPMTTVSSSSSSSTSSSVTP